MDFLLSLRNCKKRVWLISTILAFFLSVAVCLFQNSGESLFREPAFWQFAACCLVFFGAAACIFTLKNPWVPLAVTVCGAALVCVFAPSFALFFCAVPLPALLWLLLLRNFTKNGSRSDLFRLFAFVLSALLLAAIILLLIRIQPFGFSFQFFSPSQNNQLSGFWPLAALFGLIAVSLWTMRQKDKSAKAQPQKQKKKSGKAKALSHDSFFFLSSVLTLLFFASAALFYVYFCLSGEWPAPYALLIDLCGLFVLFGLYCFPETNAAE